MRFLILRYLLGLKSPRSGIILQERLEQAAWDAGGGALCAPAQRVTDFLRKHISSDLPSTSYEPGLKSADMHAVLDSCGIAIAKRLAEALVAFEHKMPGFLTPEAVLVGVESRIRVPRV